MISRSCKSLFYFTAICLIGLFSMHASSASGNEGDYSNLKYPALVKSIYQSQPKHRFWQDKSLRYELEKQIILFVLADVNDTLLASYRALRKADEQNNWQRYERLASDLLLFYISYTEQVSINETHWLFAGGIKNNIGVPSNRAIEVFFNASSHQARLKYLQALLPTTPQYTRLYKNLLKFYLSKKSSAAKYTAFAKEGEKLEQKDLLLSRLHISGDISSEMKRYLQSEDKKLYSWKLKEIIVAFQNRHGLKADGIIGKNTRYWLNISHQERIRLMALNMLRMQLWKINKPRIILVNIPDYTMEYWETGEKIFESKVIVGRTDRKTPLFSSKLDSIVFNPAWRVPSSIMRQDILPVALSNKGYLKQHQYEILASWQSKKVIDPNKINWSSITVNNFPYKLRQKPGETNALGFYKFNTPNKYAIYLHDTPAKHLFEKQNRTYSSGCIRIQRARQFVQLLMDKSGFSSQDYNKHHKEQKTSVLDLKSIIPVYTIYQTVWVDELGITQFRKDIYNYDK